MDEQFVQIEVERCGELASVRKDVLANEVAGVVRAFKGEPDVTLVIARVGTNERLLVAISGARAFVGLDSPGGISSSLMTQTPAERSG